MKYYMIGIKGAGMSSLALVLNDLGYTVAGYDDDSSHKFTEDKLLERNIKIYYEDNNEIDEDTIIIKSTAIKNEHLQVKKALDLNLKIYDYNEMLGKVANMFELITVAGCHGKTTTTSMLSHVLDALVGCNYLIGDGNGRASKENKKFVIEACEYQRHFLVYEPEYAIITNIDLDHIDYYKDMSDIISAYQEYANKASKMIIAYGDDPYTRMLEVNKPIFYYGIDETDDIVAKEIEYNEDGISFDVEIEGNYYGHFDLPFYGKHMLLNSLAVIAVCYYERLEAKDVLNELKKFKGAERRFAETIINNTIVVDDYAHHPNEVKATIKAAKQKYPNKKVIAIFRPHTFSRTKEFAEDFATVLDLADYAYVLDICPARETQTDFPDITSDIIINNNKKKIKHIGEDELDLLKPYKDVVMLFMGLKEIAILKKLYIDYRREEDEK